MSRPRRLLRWVGLCAAAEAVGMTAAAAAARVATSLADGGTGVGGVGVAGARGVAAAWGVVVLGGLVEGTSIGLAQAAALRPSVRGLPVGRFVLVTVAVAGLGWAAVSAPAVLAQDDGAPAPAMAVVVGGAAALGLATGAVLGAVQAWVIRSAVAPGAVPRGAVPRGAVPRGAVTHPWRWTWISALAWAPAMAVIFAGAQSAPAHWSTGAVALLGTVTGAVAGAALGAVCGSLVPLLEGRTGSTTPDPARRSASASEAGSLRRRRTERG
jgi:hypothetical protein